MTFQSIQTSIYYWEKCNFNLDIYSKKKYHIYYLTSFFRLPVVSLICCHHLYICFSLNVLHFPKCQLSISAYLQLASLLDGLEIGAISFTPSKELSFQEKIAIEILAVMSWDAIWKYSEFKCQIVLKRFYSQLELQAPQEYQTLTGLRSQFNPFGPAVNASIYSLWHN